MAGIKERLVQLTLRAKEFLSRDVQPASDALQGLVDDSRNLKDALNEAGRARGLARTLRDSEGATDSLRQAWKDAQATLEDLTREVGDSEQATAGQRIALREARRTADEAESAYQRSQRAIKNLRTELKALNVDTDNITAEEQRLTAEIEQNKRALNENRDAIKRKREEEKKAADSAEEHASSIESVRVGVASAAVSFGKWLVSIYLVDKALQGLGAGFSYFKDGITSMLQTGDKFELLDKRMASLMGSVAGGEQATAWIKDFAKNTPLEVADVTEAFALLKSFGLDPMDGALQAVVDKNEQLGGGMERLTGIASALGQAYAKQKLQTEEILQLVERGVPVWGLLEKVTGKNAAQLQKLATEGRLGRDVIAALIAEMGKSAEGAAAEGMSTLTGRVSNLRDVWSDFLDRISKSGAMDYVKKKLGEVAAKIDEMDKDGRLDKLAQSLSDVFVNGAESIEKYLNKLEEVDFTELAEKASEMAKKVGPAIDETLTAGQYVTATLTTVWNTFSILVTSTAAVLAKGVQGTLGSVLLAGGQIAGFFGGSEIKAEAEGLYNLLGDLSDGYVKQAKTDLDQIGSAWDFLDEKKAAGAKKQAEVEAEKTAAVKTELEQQRMLNQAHADQLVADQQRVVDAAASGQAAIKDMANAVNLIDAAKTVDQLEGLRSALLAAFREGRISQEEYAQATTLLNGRLKDLGKAGKDAAGGVSDLEEKLGDLASVQAAISNAKTDVDINNIRAALRKLYNDGEITAAQYNAELKKTSDQQKELKKAVSEGAREQDKQNEAMEEAIQTQEDLRRASGKRMEEERRAGGEAMERRRKEGDDAKKDMAGLTDFFGAVLTRAREPLAQLSAASLEAFDRIRGISTVKVDIDTSSLEATAASLQRVNDQLASVRLAAVSPGMSGFSRWQLETQRQSLALQEAALGQKLQLQQLMARYESGGVTLGQFVKQAQSAKNSMNLLDAADLSSLDSAIQSAKDQMKQLGESTRSTLEGLQDELDGLEGREAEAERRRFGARQRELEGQLAQAQASGDGAAVSNAQRALGVLRQIEAATAFKRQQEDQQKRVAAAAPAQASQPASPTRVLRLETAKGKAVDVAVNSADDETKLLSILEDAGLRSL